MLLKSAVSILGFSITVLAFYYLTLTCRQLNFQMIHFSLDGVSFSCLVGGIVMYGALFTFRARGWLFILRFLSSRATAMSFRVVFGIFVRANILKYIPGKFMEFVGRNYLAHRYGVTHGEIALSSVLEVVFLVWTAFMTASFLSFSSLKNIIMQSVAPLGSMGLGVFVIGALFVAAVVILLVKWRWPDRGRRLFSFSFLKLVLTLMVLDIAFVVGLGLILVGILAVVFHVPIGLFEAAIILGAMALSWMCGFVTPGAPGGLGVREAALFMMLSSTIAREPLMASLALHRLVSVLGDGFIFGVGSLIPIRLSYVARQDEQPS